MEHMVRELTTNLARLVIRDGDQGYNDGGGLCHSR